MDLILRAVNNWIVDPYILGVKAPAWPAVDPHGADYDPHYSVRRNFFVLWAIFYIGGWLQYMMYACTTFFLFYRDRKGRTNPDGTHNASWWKFDTNQIKAEIWVSTWSLAIMSGMVAPIELAVIYGKIGKVYYNVDDHWGGWYYMVFSVFLFLAVTDFMIYWIHRWLHLKIFYGPIHKLHHRFKHTTPFSAFHFHPLDGWLQGVPYHIFVCIFPMHNILYSFSVFVVAWWTINIHDRVTLRLPFVNGAAHHTVHHTKFNYNYGQYFTLWDRIGGTYKDPYAFVMYDENFKPEPALLARGPIQGMDEDPYPDEKVAPKSSTSNGSHANGSAARKDAKESFDAKGRPVDGSKKAKSS